jgi:hypothetical protein
MKDLRSKGYDSGFGIRDVGFRVLGIRYRVQGLGIMAEV